jgi:hypothetical protein
MITTTRRPSAAPRRRFVPLSDFHVTAGEMRQAGIRCHEEISDGTRYVPPSVGQLRSRVGIAVSLRDRERSDAIAAENAGDASLAAACRRSSTEIDAVLAVWKERWSMFGGALGPLHPGA